MSPDGAHAASALTARLHLRVGWWALVGFASLGLVLEGLHGLKIGFYLDVTNETRRLLWTLAHVHGTLLSLLNVVFALTLAALPGFGERPRQVASRCLLGGLLLMPAGFFLGGSFLHGGDPGLGVLLAPPGALLILIGLVLIARAASASQGPTAG
ncbi:MAG: hypothetical protein ACR2P8_07095 [Myxococcota bacterium]